MKEHTQSDSGHHDTIELVGDHTFSKVPTDLLLDASITNDAKVVFALLYDRGRTADRCFPSYRWMGEHMKASARSIPKWVRELEESGWVERVTRYREDHSQTSNAYRLHLRAAQRGGETPMRGSSAGGHALHSAPMNENQEEQDLIPTSPAATASIPPASQPQALTDLVDAVEESMAAAKQAARELAERRFERWWEQYPKRNGKRVGKAKTKERWMRLSSAEHEAAWVGVKNYAASGWLPKDPERWLRDRLWEDWQEPADTTGSQRQHLQLVQPDRPNQYPFNASEA